MKKIISLFSSILLNKKEEKSVSSFDYLALNYDINNFDPCKKTILIIDDSPGMINIIKEYIDMAKFNRNDYNVITFTERYAPFAMMEGLKLLECRGLRTVDYAFVDMVLPGKIDIDGKSVGMDGVDVSTYLYRKYNCKNTCLLCLRSCDIEGKYGGFFKPKVEKFMKVFKKDMMNYILYKETSTNNFIMNISLLLNNQRYILI